MNAVEGLTPVTSSSEEFSRLGIKLSFLTTLTDQLLLHYPIEEIEQWTTADVCQKVIKPLTEKYQCSFCEYQQCIDPEVIGLADAFISHAWSYRFVDVVEGLLEYFEGELDVLIWFDVFSHNQHKNASRDFNWWSNTFKTAIREIGRTVMVLSPWNNPTPLTRGWCIWELYCTIDVKCDFGIAMSQSVEKEFIEGVERSVAELNKMFNMINCENSKCFHQVDQDQIHHAIEKTIGFLALNNLIFENMRKWVIERYERRYTRLLSIHSTSDTIVLNSMFCLSLLYDHQGRSQEAESLLVQCLKGRKEVLGLEDSDTIHTMNMLALYYAKKSGHVSEEEKSEETANAFECLEVTTRKFGLQNVLTSLALFNLGKIYYRQGNYDKAESFYVKSIESARSVLEASHPTVLRYVNNLASLYSCNIMQYERAETMFKEALDLSMSTLGRHDPTTLMIMTDFGQHYSRVGKYSKATAMLTDCLTTRTVTLGPNHPDTLRSMAWLGALYLTEGNYDESEQLLITCLKTQKVVLGRLHSDTFNTMNTLANLYLVQERDEEAEPLLLEALEIGTFIHGTMHEDTIGPLVHLASIYSNRFMYDKAEALLTDGLEKLTLLVGPDHPHSIRFMNWLGVVYFKQDKFDLAEPLLQESLERQKHLVGLDHQETHVLLMNYGMFYYVQKKYQQAIHYFEECYIRSRKMFQEIHPLTLQAKSMLFKCGLTEDDLAFRAALRTSFQSDTLPTTTTTVTSLTTATQKTDTTARKVPTEHQKKLIANLKANKKK